MVTILGLLGILFGGIAIFSSMKSWSYFAILLSMLCLFSAFQIEREHPWDDDLPAGSYPVAFFHKEAGVVYLGVWEKERGEKEINPYRYPQVAFRCPLPTEEKPVYTLDIAEQDGFTTVCLK